MPASGTKTVRVLQPPPDGGPPTARSLLRLLTHTTAAVLGGDDLPNQARQIARQIRRAFRVDACIIRVLDGDQLLLLASDGVPRKLLYPRMPVGWGITEELFTRRERNILHTIRVNVAQAALGDELEDDRGVRWGIHRDTCTHRLKYDTHFLEFRERCIGDTAF